MSDELAQAPITSTLRLQQILQTYHHIAVVGFSAEPSRPSHFVTEYLLAAGYEIVLINPRYAGQTMLGRHVYASLIEAQAAGEQIELVDVFRRPTELEPVLQEAISIGAKVLWLQSGISNDEIGRRAIAAGIEFVQNRCVKIEHSRLPGGR